MEDTIVSFEVANLLKEKGFKELVNHYYLSNSEIREQKVHISYENDGDFYVEQDEFLDNFNDNFRETVSGDRCFGCNPTIYLERYSAPTQSLVQKWLREVHNIHIVISVDFYKDGINYLWQAFKYDTSKKFNCEGTGCYGDNGEYPTYENALEAAIQESLKLIK